MEPDEAESAAEGQESQTAECRNLNHALETLEGADIRGTTDHARETRAALVVRETAGIGAGVDCRARRAGGGQENVGTVTYFG